MTEAVNSEDGGLREFARDATRSVVTDAAAAQRALANALEYAAVDMSGLTLGQIEIARDLIARALVNAKAAHDAMEVPS